MSVDLSFFRSETSERLRAEGRAEGRSEGRTEGRSEDIVLILATRGIEVPEDARERITRCTDLGTLGTWLTNALTATTAEDLFTEGSA